MPVNARKRCRSAWLRVTVYTSGTNAVRQKLVCVDVSGRKCRQSSNMLNFQGQGQRWLALAFQPIRKATQGHWEPRHYSATATHGRIRSPVLPLYMAQLPLVHVWCCSATAGASATFASVAGTKKYKHSFTHEMTWHRVGYILPNQVRCYGKIDAISRPNPHSHVMIYDMNNQCLCFGLLFNLYVFCCMWNRHIYIS